MDRPISIVRFEQCYLGALALGVVNFFLTLPYVRRSAAVMQAEAAFGSWYLPTIAAISFLIPLLLWFFIARRGSNVARWIMIVLLVIGVLSVAWNVVVGGYPTALSAVLAITITVLQVIAAWLLFRPDTKPWFGRTGTDAAV